MFFVISIRQKNIYANSNTALHGDIIRFLLVFDNYYRNFKSADKSQSIMSDHKIATFFLDMELTKRGNGYWKIHNSILNDSDFIKMIKRIINDLSPHILWETLKCVIR